MKIAVEVAKNRGVYRLNIRLDFRKVHFATAAIMCTWVVSRALRNLLYLILTKDALPYEPRRLWSASLRLCWKKAAAPVAFFGAAVLLSSSGFGFAVVLLQAGDLTVGIGHELLEHVVEGLGLLFRGLSRAGALRAILLRAGALRTRGALLLRTGQRPANGQIDLPVIQADDHDLDLLADGQVLVDIIDIGVGDFGNMYHAGLVLGQRNKRAEFGDGLDLPL